MCILKLSHLMAIVPVAVLLTLSFFVLFTIREVKEKGLKVFGYAVVSLLWLATLVVFSRAIYNIGKGSVMARCMMQEKMKAGGIPQMMQQNKMPDMAMPGKGAPVRDEKCPKISKSGGNKGMLFKTE